jgi:hypothetical protein
LNDATKRRAPDAARLDRIVAEARRNREARAQTYREQALKLFPWICGRVRAEFDRSNVRELTVHHKDHNHDNNPSDGSNWELLCVYCHDNEHSRELEAAAGAGSIVRDDCRRNASALRRSRRSSRASVDRTMADRPGEDAARSATRSRSRVAPARLPGMTRAPHADASLRCISRSSSSSSQAAF